ncbi:MAG: PRC-barrel domain-containing protein [Planctomycetes bacterium]|nr:PRC-barrel domain-containing protein [Planctomycetota bacterium]
MQARQIIGTDVENPRGEDLGKVEELAIDVEDGCVAYAVISFGGFLGLGNRFFPIPWRALHFKHDERKAVLNVDKDTLRNAPGFDKNTRPNMGDRVWGAQVHSYYGYPPYWER